MRWQSLKASTRAGRCKAAQQELTNARSRQIQAQRDRVIASYTLLSAVGRLDVHTLNLNTPDYLPEVHYHQVRDAWHGVRLAFGPITPRERVILSG